MNIKLRVKNPVFWASVVLSILAPILAYAGISYSDLTDWGSVFGLLGMALKNPYVLGLVIVSLYNTLVDTTTQGITDNARVKDASTPKDLM